MTIRNMGDSVLVVLSIEEAEILERDGHLCLTPGEDAALSRAKRAAINREVQGEGGGSLLDKIQELAWEAGLQGRNMLGSAIAHLGAIAVMSMESEALPGLEAVGGRAVARAKASLCAGPGSHLRRQ